MTLQAMIETPWAEPVLRLTFGAVLGAIFGNFVGAAVVRLPLGQSPMQGRSRCGGCGRPLGPGELVPILSFILLRGWCRSCGHAIDRWQPASELGGAAVAASAALAASGVAEFAMSMVFGLQRRHGGWLPEADGRSGPLARAFRPDPDAAWSGPRRLGFAAALALGGRRIDGATPVPFGSALVLAGWIAWLYMA